jgi:hypothetical protein
MLSTTPFAYLHAFVPLFLPQSSAVAKASGDALWEELLPAPHTGAIVSASFAVRKDLLATAGEDLTVGPAQVVTSHTARFKGCLLVMLHYTLLARSITRIRL